MEMEVEVIIPGQSMDFDFYSAKSSPRFTAPSTPKPMGDYYFSAPASPTQILQFYREFDDFLIINSRDEGKTGGGSSSTVPFDWEEKPGTPKAFKMNPKFEDDFAFDVSQEMETGSLSAEELFDGGKIRPLKPPQHIQLPHQYSTESSPAVSPRSHRSPISHGKKIIRSAFSPRQKKEVDPFRTSAVEDTPNKTTERERGRERSVSSLSSSRSVHRATRSLSSLRVSEYQWEEEYQQQQNSKQSSTSSKPTLSSTTSALSSSSLKNYRKWRLKDFFLFRSASEGRTTDKDPLKKYASLFKRHEDFKSSSFGDSPGSSVSSSRRRGRVSAHELHYTMNRAVSEELKKKTFLPYKQGILGRLAFNPAVHAIANGFGFSRK